MTLFATFVLVMGSVTAQQYMPSYETLLEVSTSSTPPVNATGAITFAIGLPTDQSLPCNTYPCPRPLVSIAPAFPPIIFGCGLSATGIASAIMAGVNSSGTFTASNPTPTRVLITGPSIIGQNGYWVTVFHGEIHPVYGYVLEPALPVNNLCDGILGNESQASTGNGTDIRMVTISDSTVGSFENTSGAVISGNWRWDGVGQVSVETTPQGGFPTNGNQFLRLSTQDPVGGNPLKLITTFTYSSATPVIKFDYLWLCGEPAPTTAMNDFFVGVLEADYGYYEIVREDSFTPTGVGMRSVIADLRELVWYPFEGMKFSLSFALSNVGGNANDSVVLVDNISFLPPQPGEGNNTYGLPYSDLILYTWTWDPVHWSSNGSTADKKVMSGGAIVCNISGGFYLPQGTSTPVFLVASGVSYGSQPLASLPGELNLIGIDITNFTPIYVGVWSPGFPPIPIFVFPQFVFTGEGLYVQAAVIDPNAPNGLRVSNLIRHRVE